MTPETEMHEDSIRRQWSVLLFVIDEATGEPTDLGDRPLFWQLVRRQLASATPERPWIGGRLVQVGQAYRLDPPTEQEAALIAAVAPLVKTRIERLDAAAPLDAGIFGDVPLDPVAVE